MPAQVTATTETQHWFVVQSRPRQEMLAATAIEVRTALHTFVPEIWETHRSKRIRKPLFPGYLFFAAQSPKIPLHTIRKTPGVLRVLSFEGRPQTIGAEVISALQQRCAAINDHGGLPRHSFKPGDTVRLTAGPLAGLEGIFQGPMTPDERVRVLLTFLGRAQPAQVPLDDLERVSNPIKPRSPRRTRGKGRHIKSNIVTTGT